MDTKEFWGRVREIESSLLKRFPRGVHVATIERAETKTPEGKISLALANVAAKLIVSGSHRVATAEEIERYEAEQKQLARDIHEKLRQAKETASLALPEGYKLVPADSPRAKRKEEENQ